MESPHTSKKERESIDMTRHEKALQIIHNGTVIPATPLALDENRNFDEDGLRLLMRYYLNAEVGGIATAVHTTQFEIRDPKVNLFEKVLTVVKDEIDSFENKTGKVIARVSGVCGPKEQAVAEAKIAKSLGYDAVLLSPGGLGHLSEEELIERTKAVASEMPVIGFYLQEKCGGRIFSFDYWAKICEIQNVIAIKCASFNRYTTLDVVRAASLSSRKDEITLYTGNDDNIVVDLLTKYKFTDRNGNIVENGFKGGLLGHWTLWTQNVVKMYNMLMEAKKYDKIDANLLTLNAQVTDANAAFFDPAHNFAGCIPGVHEVLRRQGLMKGTWCINPDEVLSEGQADEITRVSKDYPHLTDDEFIKENIDTWRD